MKMPTTRLGKFSITFDNSEEFHHLKNEVFGQHLYSFETTEVSPVIIDGGAHIGLSTLYFKQLYPAARIIAFEPHPRNRELLEHNIWENGLTDITVVPAALGDRDAEVELYQDSTDARWYSTASIHPGAWNGDQEDTAPITVPTVRLSHYLLEPIAFVKLDIEGAESAVLTEVAFDRHQPDLLKLVKHIGIEFHPTAQQSLVKFVDFLERQGYTVTYWKNGVQLPSRHQARGLVYLDCIRK